MSPKKASVEQHRRDEAVTEVETQIVSFLAAVRGAAAGAAHRLHADLTVGAYRILLRVNEQGDARITDLAGYFEVGKPTMSRQVAALEDLGLVRRRPDPSDGRGFLVSLTASGRRAFQSARKRRRSWFSQRLADFDTAEIAQFADMLRRFAPEPATADGTDR